MSTNRNNFKAGLFVVGSFLLILIMIVALSDLGSILTPMQQATVRYLLDDGVQGLKIGAQVTIGHVPAGEVIDISDVTDTSDEAHVIGKDVVIRIPATYRLYDNAVIELVIPPLGSGTKLNIRSFGFKIAGTAGLKPQGATWRYEPGDIITGAIAGSPLTASLIKDLGIESTQRLQIQGIIADVKAITGAMAAKPQSIESMIANFEAMSGNLKQGSDDLKTILADVKSRYTLWLDRIDTITANADKALDQLTGILEENRPAIKSAIAHADGTLTKADEIAQNVKADWLPRFREILDDAKLGVSRMRDTAADVRTFITAQLPVIDRTFANMRLTSDQLKLASIEVRRSPWRLLYKPENDELESDNLYDAARSFALAAGSLESTAASLQAIMTQYGPQMDQHDPQIKLILQSLNQEFNKFIEAEKGFWDAMKPPKK
jgi:hypothetical protein